MDGIKVFAALAIFLVAVESTAARSLAENVPEVEGIENVFKFDENFIGEAAGSVKETAEKPNHDNVVVSVLDEAEDVAAANDRVWAVQEFEKELRNKLGGEVAHEVRVNDQKPSKDVAKKDPKEINDEEAEVTSKGGENESEATNEDDKTIQGKPSKEVAKNEPKQNNEEKTVEISKDGENKSEATSEHVEESNLNNLFGSVSDEIASIATKGSAPVWATVNEEKKEEESESLDWHNHAPAVIVATGSSTADTGMHSSGFISGIGNFFHSVGSGIKNAASFIWETISSPFKK